MKGLNPEEAALIVIDMQNDFCHEDGACGRAGMVDIKAFQACVEPIAKLVEQARTLQIPVLYVMMTLDAGTTSDAWKLKHEGGSPAGIVEKGSWGTEMYKLQPQPGDHLIEKHRYSAFIGTNLDLTLRSLNRKSIVLTGVLTNVCVESTARDGFMLDYNVTLASDGCAGSSAEAHAMTLSNISNYFGQVMESEAILGHWTKETTTIPG
ncbi:isochorismatase family cysteine hydrolase [Paenibacillus sp. HB172176]|uniref:cysteine hydrolase family protein n=1 Tax=Paenibacillus sp. HB172176 TaxID=2493690 RepID=UPI00143BEF9B|nr:isochorismatase family cysteine hydrolase [Paenibacillus sp. HB172176]